MTSKSLQYAAYLLGSAYALNNECFLSTVKSYGSQREDGTLSYDEYMLAPGADSWLTSDAQASVIELCEDSAGALSGLRMAVGFPSLQDQDVVQGSAQDTSPYIWMNTYGTLLGPGIICDAPVYLQKGQSIDKVSLDYSSAGVTGISYTFSDGTLVEAGSPNSLTKTFDPSARFNQPLIGMWGYHGDAVEGLGVTLFNPASCGADFVATPESQALAFESGDVDAVVPAKLALQIAVELHPTGGLSVGAKAGIGAAVAFLVAAGLIVGICCSIKQRKAKSSAPVVPYKPDRQEQLETNANIVGDQTVPNEKSVEDVHALQMEDKEIKDKSECELSEDQAMHDVPHSAYVANAPTDNEGGVGSV